MGRWAESCPCHQQELLAGYHVECQYKQCRAPELACGDGIFGLEHQIQLFQESLVPTATSEGISEHDQQNMILFAGKSAAGLVSELKMKFGYFQQLPHCLCGLAHYDKTKACLAAQHCLSTFDGHSPGSLHRMSKRFLDPNWSAPGEQPLKPFVVRMANGESRSEIGDDNFVHWVTALGSIKVIERPVEALHSRISKATKTAPNQSMSFVSFDLRFGGFLKLIQSHPELLHQCNESILALERSDGFRLMVQKHLGISVDLGNDRSMSNLLYRENVRMKHSKKKRTKETLQKHSAFSGRAAEPRPTTACPLAQMVGAHLGAVTCRDPHLFFLIPDALFKKCAVPLDDVSAGEHGWKLHESNSSIC